MGCRVARARAIFADSYGPCVDATAESGLLVASRHPVLDCHYMPFYAFAGSDSSGGGDFVLYLWVVLPVWLFLGDDYYLHVSSFKRGACMFVGSLSCPSQSCQRLSCASGRRASSR